MIQKCNRTVHARSVRETRKLRSQVPADMRPLFNHLIKLSIHSAKIGYCTRAGQELAKARRIERASLY